MAFNKPTGTVSHLPIINTGARARGFAGLVSDTSLLNVDTIGMDKAGKTAGLIFRAGTIAKITAINPKTGTRQGQAAATADAVEAARPARGFVAIAFSHDTCDQHGEIYQRSPDGAPLYGAEGVQYAAKPANGVNVGRVWLFVRGALPSDANGFLVKPMDVVESSKVADADKPFVTGAAGAEKDATKAIPGWKFTGQTDIDPATGYQIAEVEINRV